MRSVLKTTTVLIASALVLFSMAGESNAIFNKLRSRKNDNKRVQSEGQTFRVSGKFTGAIDGAITVSDRNVVISPKTSVYVHGEGLTAVGSMVVNSDIYVGGVITKGQAVANYVIVRQQRSSLGISMNDEKTADGKYVVPSRTNPNAGSYDYSRGYQE